MDLLDSISVVRLEVVPTLVSRPKEKNAAKVDTSTDLVLDEKTPSPLSGHKPKMLRRAEYVISH